MPEGEHVVLGIEIYPSGRLLFRIEGGPNTPALYESGEVIITDGRLPRLWMAKQRDDGGLDIYPDEWTDEFWEAYFESDPAAWETYRRVKERLEAESR